MNIKEIEKKFKESIEYLKNINPNIAREKNRGNGPQRPHVLQKVLIANRGEIAKRFFLALHEEGVPSVAVVTEVDKGQSWYEFADEVVYIGDKDNYANIFSIVAAAYLINANAIYSGYGFLSENADFVETIDFVSKEFSKKIIFMGPDHTTMRMVGDKINARKLAKKTKIPLFESSDEFDVSDMNSIKRESKRISYPVILKLSSGGGGKGMYVVDDESELEHAVESCMRIGKELYNNSSFYIEKYIKRPVHIEVQIFNGMAIGIRKCAVQRRNQKIIEESGHTFLNSKDSLTLLEAAEQIAQVSGYSDGGGAGTVEFLIDDETGKFGFMEVNTRLQVEYAVTDQSLGIDLAKWQILYYDGRKEEIIGLDTLKNRISDKDHSIECRIYAEEPENNYLPSPGTIIELVLPTYNGIRCDFGFGDGDSILPMYDPMIGKIIAHGTTRQEALIRLERALQELYIKGVKTNVNQLLRIVRHEEFKSGNYTNNLLIENDCLNFKENEAEKKSKEFNFTPIIFGAFAEYTRYMQTIVSDFIFMTNRENVLDIPSNLRIPNKFIVDFENSNYIIEFTQVNLDTFGVFINNVHSGNISINSLNDRSDDFLFTFGNSSYRVRLDRYRNYFVLRMKGESNKIDYYRMKIVAEGFEKPNGAGLITAPFQGTFVSFCRDDLKVGDSIKKDEALIILSSMKMETVIYSPIDGKVEYIIENGDFSKLIISETPDGRKIGKSLQEGELLLKISSANDERSSKKYGTFSIPEKMMNASESGSNPNLMKILHSDDFDNLILENPGEYLDNILELLYAQFVGFSQQNYILTKIKRVLNKLSSHEQQVIVSETSLKNIIKIITHYTNIKRIFSPAKLETGLSYHEELTKYIVSWRDSSKVNSDKFLNLINSIIDSYGISTWEGRREVKNLLLQYGFFLCKVSYEFCMDNRDVVRDIVHLLSNSSTFNDDILLAFNMLIEQEQAELDDSLVKLIKRKIFENYPEIESRSLSNLYYEQELLEKESVLENFNCSMDEIKNFSAVKVKTKKLITGNVPQWAIDIFKKRLDVLEKKYTIIPLESLISNTLVFQLSSIGSGEISYITYAFYDFNSKSDFKKKNISDLLFLNAYLVRSLNIYDNCKKNWIEVYVNGKEFVLNNGDSENKIDYRDLNEWFISSSQFFHDGMPDVGYIYFANNRDENFRTFKFYGHDERIIFDLLLDFDKDSPYYTDDSSNISNQRLIRNSKWPVETWADVCFGNNNYNEILIKSIDEPEGFYNENGLPMIRPVASKIFTGEINSKTVCFYMKDSRVSGGATGDREGLKYVAAAYISFMNDWPLFVWNDSAGANIGEGVVALNRGGQGFMMNSLLSENVSYEKFKKYIRNVSDERLKELFKELDDTFDLDDGHFKKKKRYFQLIAVGIGSSAGLDVYGSSQASIQLLLDSDQSYRVLTGSNVIRSVIGEDITNYEIGGAKILGKWTGIVDIVAGDKIHLAHIVNKIHELFCSEEQLRSVKRIELDKMETDFDAKVIVFDESTIKMNVDDGFYLLFKENYNDSESLVGGFARIGGRKVLVMGPRTHSGIRSISANIRAKELLKISSRTSCHQVFIFGKKWEQVPEYHKNINMQSRIDFIDLLKKKGPIRINMVTDEEGLKYYEFNSFADIVIFIKTDTMENDNYGFIKKNSTFIVNSFREAFDLSQTLIHYIDPIGNLNEIAKPESTPEVPEDPSKPYDMISSIIDRTFDENSFIEFYKEMNNPLSGPNLITGLAQLEGKTVGVIADQPLQKGGGADAFGTEKFRVFTQFLNRKNIPLVMLSNSSGFEPGSKQERQRIQAIGAESLDANILGEIPVVSIVLNQNYGGRLIHAFNKFLRPGIVYLALEKALMAVIGVDVAFELLYGKKYLKLYNEEKIDRAEKMRAEYIKNYLTKSKASNDALKTGLIDWLIKDVKDLRENIIKAMDLAEQRCSEAFGVEAAE